MAGWNEASPGWGVEQSRPICQDFDVIAKAARKRGRPSDCLLEYEHHGANSGPPMANGVSTQSGQAQTVTV